MTRPVTMVARNTLLLSSLVLCELAYAQSKTVTVTDGRPVAKAAEQLEAIYGIPITYDDPVAVHESQLQDVTEQVQRTPDSTHRVIVQKDLTLSFEYKLPPSTLSSTGEQEQTRQETEAAVADALSSILDGYKASGGPVTFKVTEGDGIFHVVPTNFLSKEGKLEQTTPILDTKITVLPKQRSRIQLLVEIGELLSKTTGTAVGLGQFPFNLGSNQAQAITEISGSDVTARSLLSQLLAEMGAPITKEVTFDDPDGQSVTRTRVVWKGATLSWHLFYGPGWGYMLNIHGVDSVAKQN